MSDSETDFIQVFLLGRFEIVWGRTRLPAADWKRRKAATLMQRLALEQRLPKEKAIDLLWPDASRSSGSNNLYRTIYALRQVLNDAFGPEVDAEFFSFVNGVLFLNSAVWVDAVRFEQLAGSSSPSVSDRQQAHALYRGDLLPAAPYSEWLVHPRESLWRLHRENSLALAGHFECERAYDQAIPFLVPLLAHDPLDELIHRELMRLYALSGQYASALRQYHICARTLKEELDIEPEEETEALLHAIKSKQIAPPPSAYPPLTAGGEEDEVEMVPPSRHNLPAFPDSFVGRTAATDDVCHCHDYPRSSLPGVKPT